MKANAIPSAILEYFAKNTSLIRTIPPTTTTPGAASFDAGFPSETFIDPNAGGFAPNGRDFQYLFQLITQWLQWTQAGGTSLYNASLQSAIGGYANGSVIASVSIPGVLWISLADDNTTNPDAFPQGANWALYKRAVLSVDTIFNVATTGSDTTGNGNPNSAGGTPFATIGAAYAFIQKYYDINAKNVTIKVANGTYTGQNIIFGTLVGQTTSLIFITGNLVTPSAVVLQTTGAGQSVFATNLGSLIYIQGFTMRSTGGSGGACITANDSLINHDTNIFAACPGGFHLNCGDFGMIVANGNYSISGGALSHWENANLGIITTFSPVVTITAAIAFVNAFAVVSLNAVCNINGFATTFVNAGSVSGLQCIIAVNGSISTNGNTAVIPGSGTSITTGGQFS